MYTYTTASNTHKLGETIMPSPSRFQLAKRDIVNHLQSSGKKVYTRSDIAGMLRDYGEKWRLAKSATVDDLIRFLIEKLDMKKVDLKGDVLSRTLYIWGDASPYEVALVVRPGSYLSHGTAVFLHGLTEQVPYTVYVNKEQGPKQRQSQNLTQENIDMAFAREQRQTANVVRYERWKVVLLNGKFTDRLEVGVLTGLEGEQLEATKLERTLIDITVRPAYAGGVLNVLEAFKSAKDRLSTNVLIATLRKLDYVYPYHQAVGFYMEKAGYEAKRYERLLELDIKHNFYLAHGAKQLAYDSRWRLFFPKALQTSN